MDTHLKALFSGEVDCVTPQTVKSGSKIILCGLGVIVIHDAARCLLKIYLNRKNQKSWRHHFGKKLLLGKFLSIFLWSGEGEAKVKQPKPPKASSAPTHPSDKPVVSRSQTEVLFFPDSGIPCKDYYSSPTGCSKNEMCQFLHDETAYLRLLRILKSAKKSIDVCVFCLTCGDLGESSGWVHNYGAMDVSLGYCLGSVRMKWTIP